MSTYVNNLRLEEIGTGEATGTWGTKTNANLQLIGESLGFATQNCFDSDANKQTTVADAPTSDPARALYFKVTSSASLTATRELEILPNTNNRVQIIENATTGNQSITIKQGSGAGVTIANGQTKVCYFNGGGSGAIVTDATATLAVPDLFVDDDISLQSDGAVVNFGADNDINLTHTADVSLTLGGAGGTTGLVVNNTAGDGDPFLAFALGGTQTFTMGVDDGDSDAFKIGTTAIGTNTRLSINSAGVVGFGQGITENTNTVSSSGNATALDCRTGTVFETVLSQATTLSFTNPAASGSVSAFTLKIKQDSGGNNYTVTFPTAVDWPASTAPTLTATANAVDIFVFFSTDGGTIWYGFVAGQAMG
jgi:hypothetical protein